MIVLIESSIDACQQSLKQKQNVNGIALTII